MKKTHVLVIGGGPAGAVGAITAKQFYPEKDVLLMRNIEHGCVPCGIPYMLASLKKPDENRAGDTPLKQKGIDVVIDEVVKIERANKQIETQQGNIYRYEKLILAVGSRPITPPIQGITKEGVYPIYKDMIYLKKFIEAIKKSRNVLIIGGGFIGVEFADEVAKLPNVKVYLVELSPNILTNSFDTGFSDLAVTRLKNRGVELITGVKVEEIVGNDRVEYARLSDGRNLEVDSIILGIGAVPNTRLAIAAGLALDQDRGIATDEYMRTSDADIFAIGDCAGKRDFFTRRYTPVMLASTATAEARVAGANLYNLKVLRENKGTIAIYSTWIDGLVLGSAGLTQLHATQQGFDVVIGESESIDKHPRTLPGASFVKVKLVFSKRSGTILGGQIAGGAASSELINMIGVAIQKRMSAVELATLQIATHPYLTSSPTTYPVIQAAQMVAKQMEQ